MAYSENTQPTVTGTANVLTKDVLDLLNYVTTISGRLAGYYGPPQPPAMTTTVPADRCLFDEMEGRLNEAIAAVATIRDCLATIERRF